MDAKFISLLQKINHNETAQPKNFFDQLKSTIEMSSDLLNLFDFLNKKGYKTKSNRCLNCFVTHGVKLYNLIHLLEMMFNEQLNKNEYLVRFYFLN